MSADRVIVVKLSTKKRSSRRRGKYSRPAWKGVMQRTNVTEEGQRMCACRLSTGQRALSRVSSRPQGRRCEEGHWRR